MTDKRNPFLNLPSIDDIRQQNYVLRQARSGTELAPGVWSDPISQSRHDYGGELAAFENAMLQIKATGDAMAGSVDNIFDIAMELAATIVETHDRRGKPEQDNIRDIAHRIRAQKKYQYQEKSFRDSSTS